MQKKYKAVLSQYHINFEEGKHSENIIFKASLVVKSPGIPDTIPLLLKLKEKGIGVISEIEFAAKYTAATLVGITGSNGKTTTALLTQFILKNAEINSGIAGNIGRQFCKTSRNPIL